MFGKQYKVLYEKLHEEHTEQSSLINAIHRSMAVIEFRPSGEIITANDNFLKTVGYDLSEIQGKHHRLFCEDNYAASEAYRDFWAHLNRGEFFSGQFKRVTKQGQPLWLEATYNPVFDANQKLIKVVKFASDISAKVIADIEDKSKLDALNRSSAIIEFEKDGTIIDCNDNFLSTVGYRKADIIGKHHRIFCEPEYAASQEYNRFWQQLNNGEFSSGQFKRVNSQGQTLWLEASYNPVYDGDGNLYRVIKFASDVTQQTQQSEMERESASIAYRISNETLNVAKSGGSVINEAVDEMNKIAESVHASSQHIERLNMQSGEINSIINTIQEIADQTNLLALNAAIEAARAGEQGRGFAVVADEVRQLAARTCQSTSEISSMISKIQEDTGSASSSMEKCLDQANRGVDLASQTGEVIGKIQTGANEVVSAIDLFSKSLSN
ncbi:methyl-accepting chemotaxis protein [Pseudoteredinibacter isoporae]|uniref:Methyl-accepting chemotaxis protein n=1 Tax=Pseudoteredinibacter isoporae TaxID=570281 RepID=A0A7X0JSQ1_9GAMM|nr:methyl-accepting chemotaxis protein [Pseudoteredinibacter isoporae]NHO87139.1 PAS domain-containing protein [Pseudoteredinibacter isoporae]NIB22963.1 PAS domain-containing protein [Pseudoteredinibacter isoporae]